MRPLPFLHVRRPRSERAGTPGAQAEARRPERGQALVMFILMSVVMIGAVAIVTDISWVWYGQQRMQRAADAAALAGAVYLPGDPAGAYASARAEASKNGFTDGSGGVVVTPVKDPLNSRRIIVTVTGPIGSFFARALGVTQFTTGAAITRRVRAAGAHGQPRELLRRGLLRRDLVGDQRRGHPGQRPDRHQQLRRDLAVRAQRRRRQLDQPRGRTDPGHQLRDLEQRGDHATGVGRHGHPQPAQPGRQSDARPPGHRGARPGTPECRRGVRLPAAPPSCHGMAARPGPRVST